MLFKSKYVVHRSKLRRERSKCREEIRPEKDCLFGLANCICLDGRKDDKSNERRGKYYLETAV